MKRIAIFLGHPAHFHLFKNTANALSNMSFRFIKNSTSYPSLERAFAVFLNK